jgi:hypothetical protein
MVNHGAHRRKADEMDETRPPPKAIDDDRAMD